MLTGWKKRLTGSQIAVEYFSIMVEQTLVDSSTCEAEYIALSKAAKEAKWLRQLLTNLHIHIEKPIIIFNANQSCLRLLNDDKFSFKTKHMDTKYKMRKDLVKKGIIT